MSLGSTTWSELTAPRAGGVAVLELSGRRALDHARNLARGRRLRVGRAVLCELVGATGELLDEGLVVVHDEARVELQVHGSRAVVEAIVAELERRGVGPAGRPGLEARALLAAARCRGAHGARLALVQAGGGLRQRLRRAVQLAPSEWAREVDALLANAAAARHLLVPPRVVLCGPPNAGKSTLFNALLGNDRALTSEAPGTTRDALVEPCVLAGLEVLLVDTAGTREQAESDAAAAIERLGQELGRAERAAADVVFELVPPGGAEPLEGGAYRRLPSRGDLTREGAPSGLEQEGKPGASAALAPLEDAEGARERVAAELFDALGLVEPVALGRAEVPFEPELRAALAGARDTISCTARWGRIQPHLGDERRLP